MARAARRSRLGKPAYRVSFVEMLVRTSEREELLKLVESMRRKIFHSASVSSATTSGVDNLV